MAIRGWMCLQQVKPQMSNAVTQSYEVLPMECMPSEAGLHQNGSCFLVSTAPLTQFNADFPKQELVRVFSFSECVSKVCLHQQLSKRCRCRSLLLLSLQLMHMLCLLTICARMSPAEALLTLSAGW